MVTTKTTTARGVWRDQGAFEYVSKEFEIPPEVAAKGIEAIIKWANDAKDALPLVALGAAFVAAATSTSHALNASRVGIDVEAHLERRVWSLFWGMKKPYHGRVVNDQLIVRDREGTTRHIPTAVLQSLFKLKGDEFLFTYLDGTSFQASLVTDPILFRTVAGFFSDDELHQIRPRSILHVEGVIERHRIAPHRKASQRLLDHGEIDASEESGET
jgi:hypothetical protein